jgi:hypothetical protein
MTKRRSCKGGYGREYIEALIEEATVDCYDEYEQATGLLTMIQDELDMPFTTRIFGLEVAVCVFRRKRPGVSGSSTFPMHTDDGRNFDDHIQVTPRSVT